MTSDEITEMIETHGEDHTYNHLMGLAEELREDRDAVARLVTEVVRSPSPIKNNLMFRIHQTWITRVLLQRGKELLKTQDNIPDGSCKAD